MTTRRERRLVSLRRQVPPGQEDHHRELWAALALEVTRGGAHAWHFVRRDEPALHLEFLEFEQGMDPREWPDVGDLLARLDEEIGPADAEEWLEPR